MRRCWSSGSRAMSMLHWGMWSRTSISGRVVACCSPVKLGEELLLFALLGHGGREAALDCVAPRLVDVGVSGWLEPLELVDQGVLGAAEVVSERIDLP